MTSLFSPALLLCSFRVHLMHLIVQIFFLSFSVQIPERTLLPYWIITHVAAKLCVLLGLLDKIQIACLYIRSQLCIWSKGREKVLVVGNMATLIQGTARATSLSTAGNGRMKPVVLWKKNWPIQDIFDNSPFQTPNSPEMLLPRRLKKGSAVVAASLK